MSRTNPWLAIVCVASVLGVGCTKQVTANDAQITNEIQSKLYADPATKGGNVAVAVKDGAVTLTGTVPTPDVELAAMKIANSASGVRTVADQLKVDTATASTELPASATSAATAPKQLAQSKPQTNAAPVTAPSRSELPPSVTSPQPDATMNSAPMTAASDPAPVARPLPPARITIPAGDRLAVRTVDAIDSGKVNEGQALRATLEAPLVSEGRVIVPAGAPVTLEVSGVKSAGRIKGNSELSLRATSLEYRGRNYPITTGEYADTGKARGKNTALKTGIGAGVGALIGGLAGGGKGAAIGAGAGGGAGFGFNALTHGQQIKIPSETVLNFRLSAPLTVPAPR